MSSRRDIWTRLRRPGLRVSRFFLRVYKREGSITYSRARVQLNLLFMATPAFPVLLLYGYLHPAMADHRLLPAILVPFSILPVLFYLLRSGRRLLSGNIFQFLISGGIWFWMFQGSATTLNRLDTIALVIAAMSLAPLLTNNIGLFFHQGLNAVLLLLFFFQHPQTGKLTAHVFRGYALDASIAFLLTAFISHLYLLTNDRIHREAKLTNLKLRAGIRESTEKIEQASEMLETSRDELRHDMEMARHVQKDILIGSMPELRDWDLAHYFRPCAQVSGDFYDVYHREGELQGVAVFDVSGHGVGSGLVTMLAKSILLRRFREASSLQGVMERVNEEFTADLMDVNNFMTGILVRCENDSVEVVNAGHCEPLFRPAAGQSRELLPESGNRMGTVLGVASLRSSYSVQKTTAKPGDMLLLFTDGIVERENATGEHFGPRRLRDALDSAEGPTARARLQTITDKLQAFSGRHPAHDDESMILMVKRYSKGITTPQ